MSQAKFNFMPKTRVQALPPMPPFLPSPLPVELQRSAGMYDNISNDQYHRGPGFSRSSLITLRDCSPAHFYECHIREDRQPRDETDAMRFGQAMHTYLLESHLFYEQYYIAPDISKSSKGGKAKWVEIYAEAGSRTIITFDDYDKIKRMSDSVDKNPDAIMLLRNKNCLYEQSMYWTDPVTGLLCKARPDIFHHNYVADIKTALNANPVKFKYVIRDKGYHTQAGMIYEARKHVFNKDVKDFPFIVIEKHAPYICVVYYLDEQSLERGVQEFHYLLEKVKSYLDAGIWPAYDNQSIALPNNY